MRTTLLVILQLALLATAHRQPECTTTSLSRSSAVASGYCKTTDAVCTMFEDPEVIPFTGYPFQYTSEGSVYVLQTEEFEVIATLEKGRDSWGTQYLVIASATAKCADGRSVTYSSSQLSSKATVFSCTVGDCTGDKCSVTFSKGTFPIDNVDVKSVVYKGTHGLGGLCYKNDPTCSSTNVKAPTVTTALPSVPTSPVYCDPSSNYCSLTDDPLVHTFIGTFVKFNSIGTFYAFNSVEMQVVATIANAKNWFGQTVSVITSATATCADGTTVTYTPSRLSYKLSVFTCVYGNDCIGSRCTVTFSKGTDPVDNVAINPIIYLGGRALDRHFNGRDYFDHDLNNVNDFDYYDFDNHFNIHHLDNHFDVYHLDNYFNVYHFNNDNIHGCCGHIASLVYHDYDCKKCLRTPTCCRHIQINNCKHDDDYHNHIHHIHNHVHHIHKYHYDDDHHHHHHGGGSVRAAEGRIRRVMEAAGRDGVKFERKRSCVSVNKND
ncbi:hypothetical protein HDU83_000911 [Entophlyctis luteolus]|nr:hypothetical protein HDU83_000911 [Entophlyctis luteolus]